MSETTVTLITDTWAVLLEALGTELPKASDKIVHEIDGVDWGLAVSVTANIKGWRRIADVIRQDARMVDVAELIRRQCDAAIIRVSAEKSGL